MGINEGQRLHIGAEDKIGIDQERNMGYRDLIEASTIQAENFAKDKENANLIAVFIGS